MVVPGDMPPPFINPNLLIYGALADAYRTPSPRGPESKDTGLSLEASMRYEELFERAYIDNLTADQSKAQTNFTWNVAQTFGYGLGSNWLQSHDLDAAEGNY